MPATISLPDISGASIFLNQVATGLSKKHEVIIYVPSNKYKEEELINGVLVKRFKTRNIARKYTVSYSFMKSILKERADIIHSHHFGYFPATAGFAAAKMKGIPHVLSTHYHPPIYGKKRFFLFSLYYFTQGLPILRLSDRILPHTILEKKMLCQLGAKKSNIDIIPSVIETEKFKPEEPKKENLVLFASHLVPTKGPDIALRIAKEILAERKAKFVFIGIGAMEKKLKREARNYKNSIVFLKNLPLSELVKWYSRASVLILPSYYEAFSRVLAEAMSCETPVVVTKVGGIPEVVDDGKTGFLVKYGNWASFKDRINQLLDDPQLRKKMGRAGRDKVIKNFSTNAVIGKLDRIYRELV
jgi:glycosyltransferase involved in cell wall biosynthesis